jgi:hypothetical protein
MSAEREKILGIISELIKFLYDHKAKEMTIKINETLEEIQVIVSEKTLKLSYNEIEELRVKLNSPRIFEVEGLYWKLIGDPDGQEELKLVGTMVDSAKVINKQDGGLDIILHRKNNIIV